MLMPTKLPPINNFGVMEYRFLSNFYQCLVIFNGHAYQTAEHAFQAAKADCEDDRKKIHDAPTPGQAKKLGKQIRLRKDWESIKVSVMRTILKSKFGDPYLMRDLQATRGRELIEGNTWGDTFWGVCGGKGLNWLGILLMEIRDSE